MAIPENIEQLANDIRTKIYGREVREALASGIEAAGSIANDADVRSQSTETKQTNLETRFEQQIQNMTLEDPSSAEIVDARGGETVLKNRLDKVDQKYQDVTAQLAETTRLSNFKSYFIESSETGDDQTDEIQFYIDKVANSPMQVGMVRLAEGNFKSSAPIILKSGVILRGAGRGKTILQGFGTKFSVIEGHGTQAVPITYAELTDMTVDATNLNDVGGYFNGTKGVYMTYMDRLTFRNLHIYNSPATGLGIDYLANTLIENVIAENCGRGYVDGAIGANGIGIGTAFLSDKETVAIRNCWAINNGNNGIMFESQESPIYSGQASVIGCWAIGNRIGFRDSGNMRLTFMGNHALENTQDGFVLSPGAMDNSSVVKAKETKITGNHIHNNGRHGIHFALVNEEGKFSVHDNHISKNGQHGIYGATPINNSRITDNLIYENQLLGIFFEKGGSYTAIENNHIFNNGKAVTHVSNYLDGIRISADTSTAIVKNLSIKNNKIYDNQETKTQRYAIAVVGGSGTVENLDIEGNDVRDNKTNTIVLSGVTSSTLSIKNNKGYNPRGTISIDAVPASPYTYKAGVTPEIVYVDGGEVTSIVKSGVKIARGTNRAISLEPNESIVITYTSTPVIKVDRK